MTVPFHAFVILVIVYAGTVLCAAEPAQGGKRSKATQPSQNSTSINVPAHPVDVVLCRPTSDSVTLSVLAYQDTQGIVAYGTQPGDLARHTTTCKFAKGVPSEIVLKSLQPNTQYYYQLRAENAPRVQGMFHTQRAKGSAFTFTVTADSHLDERTSAELYQRTLANALADRPDFHLDLGDTFMTEKHANRTTATRQYFAQRYYLGQLCASAPLFLVLGNHDGESPRGRDAETGEMSVWSNLMRKRLFPNPTPDDFYHGNSTTHPDAGWLQDFYAWEWGDALFVVLDPYWYTLRQRGRRDNWRYTLGTDQYRWLAETLRDSSARFKFVFIHQLIGGATSDGRGGIEVAGLYEWGGRNTDGDDEFTEYRPGWPVPIHPLLKQHGVSVVFHGHDHLYVKQDLDGIVYQETPQPGDRRGNVRTAVEYGYTSGTILPSSGHLRVQVSPEQVMVEYVRACLPGDERPNLRNADVGDSYYISGRPADDPRSAGNRVPGPAPSTAGRPD